MSSQSLKEKTIKGTMWSAADAFLGQGVTFVVGIILARLLSPDEYGLIGICLIFNTILSGIVDCGFSSALIRKKDVTNDDYNTMFLTNMIISIILYVLLFISTSWVADFFVQEELTGLLRVISLILIINALSITQTTILQKKLDFKSKTKASFASAILSGFIGIGMAYIGLGVWALVGQLISKYLIYTVCLWIINKWWPTLKFSIASFRYMWKFGSNLLISGILNNIWEQLYQVVVGRFYSSATLGQYTRSREYANIFSQNLTMIVQRVSYPALSEIQDDQIRMVAAYRKIIKMAMFVTTICLIPMGAISEPLINFLIGEKWHESSVFLPYICLSMTLYPLHAINLNMLKVLGRSDLFLYIEIAKKIIAMGPICLGIFVSIKAMLIGSILTGIITYFLNSYYTGKKLKYSSWMQIGDIKESYFLSFAVGILVYFFKYLPLQSGFIVLLQVFVGFIATIAICEIFKLEEYKELRSIVRRKKSTLFRNK